MNSKNEETLISFDRMKEQIEKALLAFLDSSKSLQELSVPKISFEKGNTAISYALPALNELLICQFIELLKQHLPQIRVHSFENGFYSSQALNKNIFKSDNLLENFKVEFFMLSSHSKCEISKKGNLTQEEVNVVVELFKLSFNSQGFDPVTKLKQLGASVVSDNSVDWDYIAGYSEVKRKIRGTIILPLKKPAVYDSIVKLTRKVFESNRPRAVLFEGPPGVGKTTVARIIAGDANIPLIYVPIESIMSKWYGQSSQNLSEIFDACEEMGGAIIFLDEIDSLVGSRDQNMFEATRRVLSVLLRRLDGIDASLNTITIGATNRKEDLDHALLSRFDQSINFPLPNAKEAAAIFSNYAMHLTEEDSAELGKRGIGLSGRNIKDVCEFTERRWARKILVNKLEASAPSFEYYKQAIRIWQQDA